MTASDSLHIPLQNTTLVALNGFIQFLIKPGPNGFPSLFKIRLCSRCFLNILNKVFIPLQSWKLFFPSFSKPQNNFVEYYLLLPLELVSCQLFFSCQPKPFIATRISISVMHLSQEQILI